MSNNNNDYELPVELTALRAAADNKAKEITETSADDLKAVITEKNLYATIASINPPAYIVDDYETIGELTGGNNVYFIDDFGKALTAPTSHFLEPIHSALTPVIFLIKKSSKKIKDAISILKNAGVTVYYQDANYIFEPITSTDSQEVKNELVNQYKANFSAGGTIAEFKNIVKSNANTPAIKTGFPVLDKVLDGGLYEGLYAIGAISSLGKTTFCLNIAEQIAVSGQDVIIIALEMSKYALVGRSISRLTYCKYRSNPETIDFNWCKTSRGITDGSRYANYSAQELQLIEDATNYYSEKIGANLFIHEAANHLTVEDIKNIVKRHIAFTGNRPVVIVDYLQLIQHEDKYVNGNDKIRTDFNLTELKQLSRDYKLPIIAISSFNRAGYNTEVKFECFKESGGIDFSCDVIMGLQLAGVGQTDFNVNEAKAKNPREIELVFLKNREAAVGDLIKYYYFPMFNHFEESNEDVRAEREYKAQREKEYKEQQKQNKAEQEKAEHTELAILAFDGCQNNGSALITDMVEYLGGKPTYKTLEKYIKETGKYKITGNRVYKI